MKTAALITALAVFAGLTASCSKTDPVDDSAQASGRPQQAAKPRVRVAQLQDVQALIAAKKNPKLLNTWALW